LRKEFLKIYCVVFFIKRIVLLNKSEDEEMEDKEMNEAELADLFAGLFFRKNKKIYENDLFI
jgi:hypothetical protein